MNSVRRTALRIVTRLQSHPHLRLAVVLTHGCVRTFGADEDVASLGKHFRLVGYYDGRTNVDDLTTDIEDVTAQIKKEQS